MLQRTQCIKCLRIWVFPSQWELRKQQEGAEWWIAQWLKLQWSLPASPAGTRACKAVARWLGSLTWSHWELLGTHQLSHTRKLTKIPLLTFRTTQGQDSEHMLLHNYLIFLRSGDKLPTSRKTGLILFEDFLLGQGKQTPWLSEKYRVEARKSLQFILYRLLLAKFLNRRIFSDLLENQMGCRDLIIYHRDVQEMWREKE